jgi:Domain of unknown function (DUF4360)
MNELQGPKYTASIRSHSILVALALAVLSFLTPSAQAQSAPPGLRIDAVRYVGTGCPAGSVRHALTSDGGVLSFIFDRYLVEGNAPQMTANCSVRFLLYYPPGYRLRIVGITYRGGYGLGQGARLELRTNIKQTISKMMRELDSSLHTFSGPTDDNFEVTHTTAKGDWMKCGGISAMNYFFDSSLTVVNPLREQAIAQIDTADLDILSAGFSMQLSWEKCN